MKSVISRTTYFLSTATLLTTSVILQEIGATSLRNTNSNSDDSRIDYGFPPNGQGGLIVQGLGTYGNGPKVWTEEAPEGAYGILHIS